MKRKLHKNTVVKYKRIIDEWFVNGFNGQEAYKKFYPRIKKDDTAAVNFSQIKALPEMKEYLRVKHEEAARIIEVTQEGILQELKNWIEADITETILLKPKQIKELPVKLRRLINKYIIRKNKNYDQKGNLLSETKTIELQFVSKERAIDMINKHIGFYEKDNKQKASQIDYDNLSIGTLMNIWDARKPD